jgi:hypothetical protein
VTDKSWERRRGMGKERGVGERREERRECNLV